MEVRELVLRNRSYRRFHQAIAVNKETLRDFVDLARLSATGANMQPFKFILSCKPGRNDLIFRHLAWAAYLSDWPGPGEGERPSAYIIILGDLRLTQSFGCDQGIAAQSILLGATEKGLGGCILANIRKPALSQALSIPKYFEILLVIALGKAKETVVLEPIGPEGDVKYWRDTKGVHHVPKRSLTELIIE